MSKRTVIAVALAAVVLLGLAMLFFFPPTHSAIYPVCLFHKFTGLNCPGCGSLRALHHLTHGEFTTAFRCNPLLIAGLVMLPCFLLRQHSRLHEIVPHPARWARPAMAWAVCAIVILFGVLRNVSGPAFAWMSP
jgi:Protein of unknown function (DUF2752)